MTAFRYAVLASTTALALAACGGTGAPETGSSPPASAKATDTATDTGADAGPATTAATTQAPGATCVSEAYGSLTEDQRLGQLLMVGFDTNAPLTALDDEIEESHVGNVIYLGGWEGLEKVRSTSEHLDGLVSEETTGGVGLVIAADQEGGIVHQLRGDGFTRPPRALDQAALPPAELTAAATGWGEEMSAAGVDVNLAPVADTVPEEVGTANEPIGKWGRQYGSDPAVVSANVTAFLEGMAAAGVVGVVKHFPGLGRVTGNTDFTADGIEDAVATVDDPFLQPFVAGMEAGAGMVMMSSALYPNLDPENQALYSSAIVTDLLRGRLGWDGVVVTDDVNAAALADRPAGERAVGFVAAGGDVVLNGDPGAVDEMLEALRTEVAADPTFAAQVEAAVTRVLTLKDEMGLLPCSVGD